MFSLVIGDKISLCITWKMYIVTRTVFPILHFSDSLCRYPVRLRPLILTVKTTCILTLLRSTCFCLMRCTGSYSSVTAVALLFYNFAKFGLTSFTSGYCFVGYMLCHVTYRFIFYTVLAIFPYCLFTANLLKLFHIS